MARRWQVFAFGGHVPEAPPRRTSEFWLWVAVGIAAAYSHLLMDILFSGGRSRLLWGDMMTWGVPLFWPFSHALWTYPTVPWGDVGATLILAAGMFAMLRRPRHIRLIAAGSLLAVAGYIFVRRALS